MDGHLTLLNKNGEIERIPEETFFEINPKILIIKIADAKSIYERLKQRDNKEWDINKLIAMQNEELTYAKEIASKLAIPFYQINDGQEKELSSIINLELTHD